MISCDIHSTTAERQRTQATSIRVIIHSQFDKEFKGGIDSLFAVLERLETLSIRVINSFPRPLERRGSKRIRSNSTKGVPETDRKVAPVPHLAAEDDFILVVELERQRVH